MSIKISNNDLMPICYVVQRILNTQAISIDPEENKMWSFTFNCSPTSSWMSLNILCLSTTILERLFTEFQLQW